MAAQHTDSQSARDKVGPPELHVARLLYSLGYDLNDKGIADTPDRVARSLQEFMSGEGADIAKMITVFPSTSDGVVIVKDIDFVSMCEHHLLPFVGVAHVAYLPKGHVVGLSKIPRIVDALSRRLQLQENLTDEIVDTLITYVPGVEDAACVVEAKHMCMSCRGVRKAGASMVTSALRGAFSEGALRGEFLSLVNRVAK